MTDALQGNALETQNARVADVLLKTRDWLDRYATYAPGSGTVWAVGPWRIETHYVYLEGSLEIWRKGSAVRRRIVTRGTNDADWPLWLDALEACR
jgi:hypothetical protein